MGDQQQDLDRDDGLDYPLDLDLGFHHQQDDDRGDEEDLDRDDIVQLEQQQD